MIGVGIITGNVALIVSGALMIASNAASLLLAPKAPSNSRQASALTLKLGEVPRSALFGESAEAGSLVDAFNYGGTYGTDWEVQIRALADHYCESLTGIWVNDKFEAFSADGAIAGYNGQLEVYFRHGDLVQTLPSVVTTNGPGWASSDYGAGVCYIVLCYKADAPDAKDPIWPGGRPAFLPVVKGKRCYDARLDSTVVGGSGAHRWDNPATWTWTDNLIVCRYNWSRGVYAGDQIDLPEMLLVGRGLSAAEQPPAAVAAAANLCDELVSGQKIYRADGSITAAQKYLDVENEFAAACGGQVVTRDGAVEIEPGQAKAPSFFFTDADLVVGGQKGWNEGIPSEADNGWVNTVVANYVEPDQKWQSHGAPVRRDVADIIADGGPREQTLALDLVRRAAQAGMVAEFTRRLGRLWGRGQVVLGPRFAGVEEGDWGQWTSQRHFGGGTKTIRVDSFKVDQKWQNSLSFREIASSVFGSVPVLTDGSGTFTPTPAPSLLAPDSGDWTLTPSTANGNPALALAGAVSMSGVAAIVFEHRVYNVGNGIDDNWLPDGVDAPGVLTKVLTGNVLGGTQYEVSIRYRVSGELTPRRIKGPVTTAAGATLTSLIASSTTNGLTFSVNTSGVFNISNHSRNYDDIGAVAVTGNASFASGAAAGDLVLVYYDDQARAGGAVTYQKLVLAGGSGDDSAAYTSAAHPYRHFVCFAFVPATGTTSGGSDPGDGGGARGGGGRYSDYQ